MTRDDEPRFCVHCGNHIARDGEGNWTYAVWAYDDRISDGIGIKCPSWEPGRLREPVDTFHRDRHFPGILIVDMEAVDIEDWDDLETNDYRGGV